MLYQNAAVPQTFIFCLFSSVYGNYTILQQWLSSGATVVSKATLSSGNFGLHLLEHMFLNTFADFVSKTFKTITIFTQIYDDLEYGTYSQ